MRFVPALICALALLDLLARAAAADEISFDRDPAAAGAPGWTIAMTHAGGAPQWSVIRDPAAPSPPNVLAQLSADAASSRYPLAILDGFETIDGALRVKFRAVSGKVDQAAGLVWRYADPDNYYVVRANALEDNVVLYKVEKGTRTALAPKGTPPKTYGVKHAVPSGTWCELAVEFRGSLFSVSFNGEKLFEVEDSTFTGPGRVGLWTKADSVTHFDDFSFEKR
jgi:hypothetical protein